MIHLAYFSYVYVCCYVMQINYCYYCSVVAEASAAIVKLTGSCVDYQSNDGTTSVSQDFVDKTALDDNYQRHWNGVSFSQ